MKFKQNAITLARPFGQISLAGLYMELDGIHWGWKLVASIANWMILAGFIVLPSAFDDEASKLQLNYAALRAASVALLLIGYLITGILCWYFKNILFQVEAIFGGWYSPGFTGSLFGIISSLFNVYGKKYEPGEKKWNGAAIAAVSLSGVFMILYGATVWNGSRKIDLIRRNNTSVAVLQSQFETPSSILTERYTRQQLMRLLLESNEQDEYSQRSIEVPGVVYSHKQEVGSMEFSPGPRRDRERSRSSLVMSATVRHDEAQADENFWRSLA